jgi:tetratricopeptide (TPR) repeat protein
MAAGLALLLVFLAACRGPQPGDPASSKATAASSETLLERQLLEVVELEKDLDAEAAKPDAEFREVQRRFDTVTQRYNGLVANNPDSLETRLLYGKLLSRFNDSEGALEQFQAAESIIRRLQAGAPSGSDAAYSSAELEAALAVVYQDQTTVFAEIGDPSLALHFAKRTVELQPGQAAYHFGLGQVLAAFHQEIVDQEILTRDQLDAQMLQAFATAKDLQPDNLDLQFRYGQAFLDTANPDWQAALAHWQTLAPNPALSPLQQQMVDAYIRQCQLQLAPSPP